MDNLYMIPFLSKELNLLGYPKLPYGIKKNKIGCEKKLMVDSNPSDIDSGAVNLEISFDEKEMIETLISVCNSLVKDVKMNCYNNDSDSDEYDRIRFENLNLQKKVNSLKAELNQKIKIISTEKEKSRQLMVKLSELQGKIKSLEREKLKIIQHNQSNEETIKHKTKIFERDLFELHRLLYREANVVDVKYLPGNFQILNPKYPDFKKLWSEVKYSRVNNKELALKKAVCIFQENNEMLMAENASLKTLLFVTLEEINHLIEYASGKMNLSLSKIDEKGIHNIFLTEAHLQPPKYKEYIWKQLEVFFNIINCFEEFSFCVDDNAFICLTDALKKLRTDYVKDNKWQD